jgi:hypothetical protein
MERDHRARRRTRHRRIRIRLRAADTAHGIGAAVLFVIGVQDKKDVESPLQHRIWFVLELGHLEQHVQKIALCSLSHYPDKNKGNPRLWR